MQVARNPTGPPYPRRVRSNLPAAPSPQPSAQPLKTGDVEVSPRGPPGVASPPQGRANGAHVVHSAVHSRWTVVRRECLTAPGRGASVRGTKPPDGRSVRRGRQAAPMFLEVSSVQSRASAVPGRSAPRGTRRGQAPARTGCRMVTATKRCSRGRATRPGRMRPRAGSTLSWARPVHDTSIKERPWRRRTAASSTA